MNDGEVVVEQVQVADLENSAYVPAGSSIIGRQVGNWMWRSPEARASGNVNKPSDMFSFGAVCIYALTKRAVFAVDEKELAEGIDKLAIVTERQLSYFSDLQGLEGLIQHLGDNPWAQLFAMTAGDFNGNNPRAPFALWADIEQDFRDLVGRMMNVDPKRRLTADEALAHPWFVDVP